MISDEQELSLLNRIAENRLEELETHVEARDPFLNWQWSKYISIFT